MGLTDNFLVDFGFLFDIDMSFLPLLSPHLANLTVP
jgi:hypothetical protein